MARLHLRHRDIAGPVIDAISTMHSKRAWEKPRSERATIASEFFSTVIEMSPGNLTAPIARFERGRQRGLSNQSYRYKAESHGSLGISVVPAEITFRRWRTVEVIAGLRHHILTVMDDGQGDPMTWACSAFYLANPVAFRAAARAGKITDVNARDTYTEASWGKLLAGGLADRQGNLRFPAKDCAYFIEHGDFPPTAGSVSTRATAPRQPSVAETAVADVAHEEMAEAINEEEDPAVRAGLSAALATSLAQEVSDAMESSSQEDHPPHPQVSAELAAELAAELEEDTPQSEGTVYQEATEGPFRGTLVAPNEITDGLGALGIVQLRRVSRGSVSGGYSMTKPVLIHAIRQALSAAEIANRIGSL